MTTLKRMSTALAALVLSGGVAAAAVATSDLNLRAEPAGQVIGIIPAGAAVEAMGCEGGWCKVNYAGRVGFASASYLSGEVRAGGSAYRQRFDANAYDAGGYPTAKFSPFGNGDWSAGDE